MWVSAGNFASVLEADQRTHPPVDGPCLGFHDGHVDVLADPLLPGGEQPAHSRNGCGGPGLVEQHVHAQLDRLSLGYAGGVHLAPHPVDHHVGQSVIPIGASLAEVGDGGHH